ncbi:MAG TPA: hypothetical protein VME86_17060 [Acidobacteriaceae bacterium]|nr:hypothetical protein [Acidobacteriaceae bacterium]
MSDPSSTVRTNGAGAAAVLAAGVGSLALGVLAVAGDLVPKFGRAMIFYKPTGLLSGVTTTAIMMWLAAWALLHARWRGRDVEMRGVGIAAFVLLCVAVLLTFPPVEHFF